MRKILNIIAYIIFFLLFYVTLSNAQTATATPTATPTCVPNGLACITNSQCCSNYCNTGSIFPLCQAVLTPTASSTPPFIPTPTPSPRPTPRPVPTSHYPTATATAPRPTPTPNPICNLPQSNFGTLTVGCPVIPSGTKGSVNAYDGTGCPFYNNGTPICGGGISQFGLIYNVSVPGSQSITALSPTVLGPVPSISNPFQYFSSSPTGCFISEVSASVLILNTSLVPANCMEYVQVYDYTTSTVINSIAANAQIPASAYQNIAISQNYVFEFIPGNTDTIQYQQYLYCDQNVDVERNTPVFSLTAGSMLVNLLWAPNSQC